MANVEKQRQQIENRVQSIKEKIRHIQCRLPDEFVLGSLVESMEQRVGERLSNVGSLQHRASEA